ncbi:MAG: penicillin-binding transpeptidase domain-containing protein, partial [Rhodothermales bacterium]|nr:penicillin-binding transpeptidase domain-containing protein [Rhodothermales bacterium]
ELGLLADEVTHVRTTLDARLQQDVEALARTHLARLNSENVGNAAALVLDNATGEVLAYLGSVDFWDAATGGQNDGVLALRQPGSALKPFTYALALESGRYTPATILADLEVQIPEAGGAFAPQNYDKTFHGPIPFREALANSYNVPAVRLARELGHERLLDQLHAFGFASLSRPAEHYGVGLTLGNGEVQLLELARSYAAFARGGDAPELRAIAAATTAGGHEVAPEGSLARPAAVSPDIAFLIADILSDPEARQAAFGRYGPLELPFPAAVKTGTTKDYRDNWAIGFTPAHTVAVWVGNFDGSPMQRVSGVSGAGPLFKSIMQRLGPGGAFAMPAGIAEALVCPASGHQLGAFCPVRQRVWMRAGAMPADTCSVHREVVIDRRSGLLADASTPPAHRQPTRYTVYPPEFHGWMRDRGLPLPPTVTLAQAGPDDAPAYDAGLRVAYPVSGARFQIDPVLRRSFQRIPLEAVVNETLGRPNWWIDGAPADLPLEEAFWTLAPGSHTFELRARTLAGAPVRSLPAHILVIDPLLEPPSLADPRELRVSE